MLFSLDLLGGGVPEVSPPKGAATTDGLSDFSALLGLFAPAFAPAPEVRSSEVPEFRSAGVPEFRGAEVSEFRSSGVPEFRGAEVPEFRSAEVSEVPGAALGEGLDVPAPTASRPEVQPLGPLFARSADRVRNTTDDQPPPSRRLTPMSTAPDDPSPRVAVAPTVAPALAPIQTSGHARINSSAQAPIDPSTQSPIHPSTEPPIDASTHRLIHPSTEPPIDPSTHRPIHPSTQPSIDASTHRPIHPSTQPSIDATTQPPIHPTTHPPIHPSTQPPIHPPAHPVRATAADGTPALAKLIDVMRVQQRAGGGHAEVQLRPEFLGAVTVTVEVVRGVVRASIAAETPQALEFLRAEAGGLEAALAEHGLTLDALDLHEDPGLADRQPQEDPREPRREEPAPRRRDASGRGPLFADVFERQVSHG